MSLIILFLKRVRFYFLHNEYSLKSDRWIVVIANLVYKVLPKNSVSLPMA